MIRPGTGTTRPGPTDIVTVLYSGWTIDGKCFDSSILRNNRPSMFPLNNVLAGWSEGLRLMVVGEKRRLWIPEALAFKGVQGKPRGTVIFDIELVEFRHSGMKRPNAGEPPDRPPPRVDVDVR